MLGVAGCDQDDLYAAIDWRWPVKNASKTPCRPASDQWTLVLYDVSSAAFEAAPAHWGRSGTPATGSKAGARSSTGCRAPPRVPSPSKYSRATPPPQNPGPPDHQAQDPSAAAVCLVGDLGMLTNARIRDELRPAQLDWLSALRSPQIKTLLEDGALQLSLFDEQNLVEIDSPHFPEQLVCCHNPVLPRTAPAPSRAARNHRHRTGQDRRGHPPRETTVARAGQDRPAGGKVIGHYNMAKHFTIEITDEAFTFTRNTETIAAEAALDGIYVLRTSLPADTLPADHVVLRYKGLEDVERFFRTLNSELDVRPIRHRLPIGCAPTCSCACCPTTSAGT